MAIELAPCPFRCGTSKKMRKKVKINTWDSGKQVECGNCEATGPRIYLIDYIGNEEKGDRLAAEAWNKSNG